MPTAAHSMAASIEPTVESINADVVLPASRLPTAAMTSSVIARKKLGAPRSKRGLIRPSAADRGITATITISRIAQPMKASAWLRNVAEGATL